MRPVLEEIEAPDSQVERAWFEEAERRRQELLTGKVEGIPAETVFARLNATAGIKRSAASATRVPG
jgi:hypothetical protein